MSRKAFKKILAVGACLVVAPSIFALARFSGEIIEKKAVSHSGNSTIRFIYDESMYSQKWDTLAQPLFWKQVILLTEDSCILNVASTRQILGKVSLKYWRNLTEDSKNCFRDSLRTLYNLAADASIYITTGKKEFYNHKKVIPEITEAIRVFNQESVDPWYAQVILLIESPGRLQKSSVGAYGPFQLMKAVGKKYGLKINKYVDERADFDKAAMAAARLLGSICVPKVKKMLDDRCITYNETDLWFRLMVLHAYHAGSGNVAAVINKIAPVEGGMALITKMWQTEAGGFKNASQNYSQIGLASLLAYNELVNDKSDLLFIVSGDKMFNRYKTPLFTSEDTVGYLSACLRSYEEDLISGTIPVEYFISKIKNVEEELVTVCDQYSCSRVPLKADPSKYFNNEAQLDEIGRKLMKLRRTEEAIVIFKLNAEANPYSSSAHLALSDAYQRAGIKNLSLIHSKKAAVLAP